MELPKTLTMMEITKDELREMIREENEKTMKIFLNIFQSNEKKEKKSSILTIKEAGEYLKVSRQTINNWVKSGILKKRKIQGRVYFNKSDLDSLM